MVCLAKQKMCPKSGVCILKKVRSSVEGAAVRAEQGEKLVQERPIGRGAAMLAHGRDLR